MTRAIAVVVIAFASIVASEKNTWAQGASSMTRIIKSFEIQMPELSSTKADIREHGDSVQATYHIPNASKPNLPSTPLLIQISYYPTVAEAEQGVKQALLITNAAVD
jgi:hypothetical protein